jgi:hypothetical protein
MCRECEILWIAGLDLPYPGYKYMVQFMDERGLLNWKDILVDSSTRDGPPPSDVRILRRAPFRKHKPAAHEPPWGEVGGVLCPYCQGNLLDAEIPPGVKFSFCDSCEALWPAGTPLTPTWPTCLADYLDEHHATWDDVTNLGRRREA